MASLIVAALALLAVPATAFRGPVLKPISGFIPLSVTFDSGLTVPDNDTTTLIEMRYVLNPSVDFLSCTSRGGTTESLFGSTGALFSWCLWSWTRLTGRLLLRAWCRSLGAVSRQCRRDRKVLLPDIRRQ
jgi:hypothetical protein